jgi:hypothetical protein
VTRKDSFNEQDLPETGTRNTTISLRNNKKQRRHFVDGKGDSLRDIGVWGNWSHVLLPEKRYQQHARQFLVMVAD